MVRSFSIYLDAVRFIAAMTVFASHLVYDRWTGGAFPERAANFLRQSGDDAVAVFFVLSGMIIAYTASTKDSDWRAFSFSRTTRIFSVAAPAILLTFALDGLGRAMNPLAYDGWWYSGAPLWQNLMRGLTFTNELWFSPFRIGSNGPFWSLGFEVWYYVLFGLLFFLSGWRRVIAVAAGCLLLGPSILLLAPVWFLGVWLFARIRAAQAAPVSARRDVLVGGVLALAPLIAYLVLRDAEAKWALYHFSASFVGEAALDSMRYARFFLWWWAMGVLIAAHFYGAFLLLRRAPASLFGFVSPAVRWLAGASFSVYLVHYPALQFLDAVVIGEEASLMRAVILGFGGLAFCFAFAELFERQLGAMRQWLNGASRYVRGRAITA